MAISTRLGVAGLGFAAAVAAAAAAMAGAHPIGEARGSRCAPPGTVKLWASPRARVYRNRHTGSKVACWMPTGRRTVLDYPPDFVVYPPPAIAIAGPLIATAGEGTDDPDARDDTIILVDDLRTGERAEGFRPRGAEPFASSRPHAFDAKVGSMKVKPNGAVAWIACRIEDNGPEEWGDPRPNCIRRGAFNEVRKYDARSPKPKTLDRGRGIDPRSLRRKGSRIYWRHGSLRKSATLG